MMAVRVLLVGLHIFVCFRGGGFNNKSRAHEGAKISFCLIQHCVFFLQDHDVQEEKIMLVSLLMAEMGVHSVAYAFPQVKIITTAVDKTVNDLFHIVPGIGEL